MLRKRYFTIPVAITALLLTAASCSDDLLQGDAKKGQGLSFSVTTEPWDGGLFKQARTRGSNDCLNSGIPVTLLEGNTADGAGIMLEGMAGAPVTVHKGLADAAERGNTRGKPMTAFSTSDQFALSAYVSGPDYEGATEYFSNQVVNNDGSGNWTMATPEWWPMSQNMCEFNAWWPYDPSNANPKFDSSLRQLTYEVQPEAKDQQDLLYAKTEIQNVVRDNGTVPLTFKHALTAIVFKGGSDMYNFRVKSVTLKNIQYKGDFDMETGQWSLTNDVKDFTLTFPYHRYWTADEGGVQKSGWQKSTDGSNWSWDDAVNPVLNDQDASGNDLTLMMMPQSLVAVSVDKPKSIQLIIDINKGSGVEERTVDLLFSATDNWVAGSTVVYTLQPTGTKARIYSNSISESPTNTNGMWTNSSRILNVQRSSTYRIVSWRYVNQPDGSVKKVITPFKIDNLSELQQSVFKGFMKTNSVTETDHSNWEFDPDYVQVDPDPEHPHTYIVNLLFPENIVEESGKQLEMEDYFKTAPSKGSAGTPFNLSNGASSNCYIVSEPGYYQFIAVKGNDFVNSEGLSTAGTTLSVYPDETIIKNPHLSADGQYITFETVAGADMKQGNVLIRLMNGSIVVWAWHIWVTVPSLWHQTTDVTANGYTFFPIELGTIYSGVKETYEQIVQLCNLIQTDEAGNALTYAGNQHKVNITIRSWGVTFQSARNWVDNREFTLCNYYWGYEGPGNNSVKSTAIDAWNKGNISTDKTTASVQKSIYDPSPIGYKMAPPKAFDGLRRSTAILVYDGSSGQDFPRFDLYLEYVDNGGIKLWTDETSYYYWTAGPADDPVTKGWAWSAGPTDAVVKEVSVKTKGIVRPVKE